MYIKDKISNSCHNYVSPDLAGGTHYTNVLCSLSPLSLGDCCPRLPFNLLCSSSSREAEVVTVSSYPARSSLAFPLNSNFLRKWKNLADRCVPIAIAPNMTICTYPQCLRWKSIKYLQNCIANVCLWMFTMLLTILRMVFFDSQSKTNILSFSLFRFSHQIWEPSGGGVHWHTYQLWRHSNTPHYNAEES